MLCVTENVEQFDPNEGYKNLFSLTYQTQQITSYYSDENFRRLCLRTMPMSKTDSLVVYNGTNPRECLTCVHK